MSCLALGSASPARLLEVSDPRAHSQIRPLRERGSTFSDIAYSFDPSEAEERIEAWCTTLPSNPTGPGEWTRGDIEERGHDEHSTYAWVLKKSMLERSGFRIESADYSADGILAQYIGRERYERISGLLRSHSTG